ncbi:hypothetical protein SAMN05216311_12180 [Chitinophaga sp. CF418]|nr:hypothetical protein SAMN05216311_12180 [Chitinophaga sp. CF418]
MNNSLINIPIRIRGGYLPSFDDNLNYLLFESLHQHNKRKATSKTMWLFVFMTPLLTDPYASSSAPTSFSTCSSTV